MNERLSIILLGTLVVLVAGLVVLGRERNTDDRYPLFLDGQGKVVDPYLQREVKNTMTAHMGEIQKCYNQLLERSGGSTKAEGTIHLDWMVDAKGKANQIRVIYSQIPDNGFIACIQTAIGRSQFPPPETPRYAEHKFSFSKQAQPPSIQRDSGSAE